MRSDLRQILELIARANDRGQLALADRPELIAICEELFDAGYLIIAPPGHRYRVSDAGRAALAPVAELDALMQPAASVA